MLEKTGIIIALIGLFGTLLTTIGGIIISRQGQAKKQLTHIAFQTNSTLTQLREQNAELEVKILVLQNLLKEERAR